MGKTKRQHYVPQFYLRRFSQDGKRIHVYDKILRKTFPDGIRNVAQESYFNDVLKEVILPDEKTVSECDLQIIEHALSRIEDMFSKTVEDMLSVPEGVPIPTELRADMS